MELYVFEDINRINNTFRYDKFFKLVYLQHINDFGEESAVTIKRNVKEIFDYSNKIVLDSTKNNNILLVGKIQSGKTANLLMFTAMALDNKYDLVIVYGGYDLGLLQQTRDRFKKTFGVDDYNHNSDAPIVYSTLESDKSSLRDLDSQLIEELKNNKTPIIIISLKRSNALDLVNETLKKFDIDNLKAFIIDDEGDQAGLNNKKDKENDASATYASIIEMKRILKNPLYLSVTATPHANIFLNEFSELRPDSIKLINPSVGYTGAESFHLNYDRIYNINPNDLYENNLKNIPYSLKTAIDYYFIASAIMKIRQINNSDMIIHSHREVEQHSNIYKVVQNYVGNFQDLINDKGDLTYHLSSIKKIYSEDFFDKSILDSHTFDRLVPIIKKVILSTNVIIKNGTKSGSIQNERIRKHKIYIGGDLLQRGLTFDNLVTTYFTRWAKEGNMDTNLQRARWFGYRLKYFDLCKIFLPPNISNEFAALAESEEDLWEQIVQVEKNELSINDILISADNSYLRPTRKSVADYKKIAFSKKWNSQREASFDPEVIKHNNKIIHSVISKYEYIPSTVGRIDNRSYAKYAEIDNNDFIKIIKECRHIFDIIPLTRKSLLSSIRNEKIILIIMPDIENRIRQRNFDMNNKIDALQQGADTVDNNKKKFLGDRFVLVDRNAVNVQLYKIHPKQKNVLKSNEYIQYMFSIYFPKYTAGYRRD